VNARAKILFLDRDGCLIEEPEDFQIDSLSKFKLLPGVIAALQKCVAHGFELVMVTNQDGLGTTSFPEETFWPPHNMLLDIFSSQGLRFRDVFIDRHLPYEVNETRKPKIGMVMGYLRDGQMDSQASAMVGDRDTDMQFAQNLGIRGFRVGPHGFDWAQIAHRLCDTASVERKTKETDIQVAVNLDLQQPADVKTGLGFFDHMLEQIGRHAGIALTLRCAGDLHIDEHHTIEDCALALGTALRQALGDKRGIGRYGFTLPMDETLASAALDLSGRPYFVFDGKFSREKIGEMPTELVPHFFRSVCETLGANLHLSVRGENDHHQVEACFKVFARVLRQAIVRDGLELPSTKGSL
jgi:imidazoleglycerol-phosphate dehydratase / histidinol-phosphatase